MSGGHFDYKQYELGQIADEIESLMNSDDYRFKSKTLDKFDEAVDLLRMSAVMVNRIDWLVSGDDGEDSFIQRWDDELSLVKDSLTTEEAG